MTNDEMIIGKQNLHKLALLINNLSRRNFDQ